MSKKAPSKKKREIFPLDFITELFGLSPTEFLDELFDSANIVSTSVTDAIQEYLDTEYNKKYEGKYKDEIETVIFQNFTVIIYLYIYIYIYIQLFFFFFFYEYKNIYMIF